MTTSKTPRPTFVLTLEALDRWYGVAPDEDGTRRLRAALKALLRCYGLRCRMIERVATLAPGKPAAALETETAPKVPPASQTP